MGKKNNLLPAIEKGGASLMKVWENEGYKEMLPEVCGCTLEESSITLQYFDTQLSVIMPECRIEQTEIPLYEQVLILHYLSRPFENGVPQVPDKSETGDNRWITFKQLPNAEFYNPTYQKRGPKIIVANFAAEPRTLLEGGMKLGGKEGEFGDYSVIINPLPAIQAMTVLYAGDDELPPEAEILFTPDIQQFLPLEDTAVLAGIIAYRLKKSADSAGG